jgi:phosphatidyl-myo-inositol dimannoside synthase
MTALLSSEAEPRVAGAPRTLLITDRYLPEVGGSIVWFCNVYRRYPPGTVCILTRRYPGARAVDATFPGIRVTRLDLRRYRFLRPESLLVLVKLLVSSVWLIRRHSLEMIHASKVYPEGFVARLAAKLTRIPYVVYAHAEELTVVRRDPAYAPNLPRLLTVYEEAAAVIANSEFTKAELESFGVDGRRIRRISPGVDPEFFRPKPRDPSLSAEHGLDGKFVLLSVGRLQKRKGHDHVIRALPAVLEQVPNLVYLVVSDGEEKESLQRLATDLGVAESVRFTGKVPLERLVDYYSVADIFILANRQTDDGDVEGFGIVFLEAGACSRAVIAGDSGGTADPVRQGWNGLRIDASRPEEIARALLELSGDPDRRQQMGLNGRQLVEAEYGWEVTTERILDLSREVRHRERASTAAAA